MGAMKQQIEEGGKRVLVMLDGIDFLIAGLGAKVEDVMGMLADIREVRFSRHKAMAFTVEFWKISS